MKLQFFSAIITIGYLLASCTPIKLAIPEQFSSQATSFPVKGLKGFNNSPLTFGDYSTSKIKGGWVFTNSRAYPDISVEAFVLGAFGVGKNDITINKRDRYRYDITDGRNSAEVFCREEMTTQAVEFKTNTKLFGDISTTKKYCYTFSSVIVPLIGDKKGMWKVTLYNFYDKQKDTARKWYETPDVEEFGYATNGFDTIGIRPVRVQNVTSKNGRESKLPIKILTAYELRLDDGVIAIVDAFGHNLWMYNNLDAPTRLIVAALSSGLLLRKVQDVTG